VDLSRRYGETLTDSIEWYLRADPSERAAARATLAHILTLTIFGFEYRAERHAGYTNAFTALLEAIDGRLDQVNARIADVASRTDPMIG